MPSSETREELLRRAIAATAASDPSALAEIFADDVSVWSPGLEVSSREQLAEELAARDEAFGELAVEFRSVGVVDDRGYAEWTASATHVAALVVDDIVIEATDESLTLRGVTVAEFKGERITALRQYWNEAELLEGLGLLPDD